LGMAVQSTKCFLHAVAVSGISRSTRTDHATTTQLLVSARPGRKSWGAKTRASARCRRLCAAVGGCHRAVTIPELGQVIGRHAVSRSQNVYTATTR
jgi:hypothetical protein